MTTTTDTQGVTIVDRPEQHRYELHVDGEVRGLVVYCDAGSVRAIVHTEIDARMQGNGLAGQVIRRALQDIAATGRQVKPACGYAAWYIEQHPEFQPLLSS